MDRHKAEGNLGSMTANSRSRGRRTASHGEDRLETPDAYPANPPPGLGAADHSCVLQTVMELQKSTGSWSQTSGL